MKNGTVGLISAYITKQGSLGLNLSEKNGTLIIQVEDAMGAKNVLLLQVNVKRCMCQHAGKCYKKSTIIYPVQLSDYFCQCKKPYTGDFCEVRPNPCEERPCYPGLKCNFAQNSEGFTCEECPALFKGDGKQCELDTAKGLYMFCELYCYTVVVAHLESAMSHTFV